MDVDAIKKAANFYRNHAGHLKTDQLGFFVQLFETCDARSKELGAPQAANSNDPFDPAHPDKNELDREYWIGETVLSKHPIAVEPIEFAATLQQISDVVAKNPNLAPETSRALSSFAWDAFVFDNDVEMLVNHPNKMFAATLTVDVSENVADATADAFHVVMAYALRTHLDAVSHTIHEAFNPRESIVKGSNPLRCPVCGSEPSLSLVGPAAGTDGNGREQYCPVCGFTWPFERIRCGKCGSKDQSKLHYTSVEGDPAHRIQTCDVCGEHSLVVFQPDLKCEPSLEIEDVIMGPLAALAKSHV